MNVIVDYGMGNLGSILNMIKRIGSTAMITSDRNQIELADKIVLPGVGAFDQAVKNLDDLGLVPVITDKVFIKKIPILGICLGMQLLLESSEEGSLAGLGLVPGKVRRFQLKEYGLRVPHMGWNIVQPKRPSYLLDLDDEPQRFYFVHSFYVECDDKDDIAGVTNYGHDFTSVLEKDNIFGVQFHPEKSHRFGMALMKRFVELQC